MFKSLGKIFSNKPPAKDASQEERHSSSEAENQAARNKTMPPDLSQPFRSINQQAIEPDSNAPEAEISTPQTQQAYEEPKYLDIDGEYDFREDGQIDPSLLSSPAPQPEPAQASPSSNSIQMAAQPTRQSLVGKIWETLSGQHSQQQSTSGTTSIPSRLLEAETLEDQFDQIEEILLRADVGLETAIAITNRLRSQQSQLKTVQDVMNLLKQTFGEILAPYEVDPLQPLAQTQYEDGLNIVLVVGVNGAGKTTFIGKLAHQLLLEGQQVVIGAGDTFRAAATEQLQVWAERAGAYFVSGKENGDPAAVIFDALSAAREQGAQTVILDTAGRLQNKFNLMEELRKIRQVIEKDIRRHSENLPEGHHVADTLEVLLVLDATTGQNALKQAEVFKEAVELTGVVLTKLDGSAKGGVILSVAQDFHLPVKYVGVGEKIEDLKPFVASEFIESLFSKF